MIIFKDFSLFPAVKETTEKYNHKSFKQIGWLNKFEIPNRKRKANHLKEELWAY